MTASPLARFQAALRELPLIAILRGLTPAEAPAIGDVLVEAGFRLLEVPLNSPSPLDSIAVLRKRFPQALVGAGTVLTAQEVGEVASAGGELVVAPNFDREVVVETVRRGMVSVPGIMTPTEAFAALAAGAHVLKLLPAELASPAVVKALLAVLPRGTPLIPVGGLGAGNLREWQAAGAAGFGLGSSLYRPGDDAVTVRAKASAVVAAYRA
ncbi:MAG: 2-dehydro-3-deoxy-6-phosphogalactonate aldolase [Alphaproteobacteria bacterium]|nr:2-dehydro-3-deoxy-6-phosphogalactonate aldolase [Alphaproteobacteria bacterium]